MKHPRKPTKAAMHLIAILSLVLGGAFFVLWSPSIARADFATDLEAPFRAALESGSFGLALALIFVVGLATSLTPCVYPMIVITVSVFGARQTSSRKEGAMLSLLFVLGMASLFTPLGVAVALTGGVFGAALASPWVLTGIALLFTALALSMFGAFELNLPSKLRNRLAQVGGIGLKGAFLLGMVSALVAAPCTGPVLAFLLIWVGTTGNAAFGALSLFVYSLGLGTLFFLVGTFAISLPKSGRWLETVKSVFGVFMLVGALYYLRDLLPFPFPAERSPGWLGIALGAVCAGVLVGGIHLSFHGAKPSHWVRKVLGIALATGGLFASVAWMLALPPGTKITWREDLVAAQQEARDMNKPLLVDFGASWCGACGELDRETFSHPEVVALAQKFVAVRIDLSPGEMTEQKKSWLASYQQKGLPLVVIHKKDGSEHQRFTSFVPASEFTVAMKRVL